MKSVEDEVRDGRATSPIDESRLAQVLEEYRALLEGGVQPDRKAFLARYADLGASLAECLDGLEFVHTVAPLLSGDGPAADANRAPEFRPVALLGDFRIVRQLGRGGMGVVYEAEQLSLGRRVALKILPFAATMDERQLQRFQNEARAAACLEHAHIVPIYGVGCERGVHYFAMKFIDGRSLADSIAHQRAAAVPPGLPTPAATPGETVAAAALVTERTPRDRADYQRVAAWGLQAAEALDYAHEAGVVHRDIKPANLLLDGHGKLWVADFGLARVGTDVGLTLTGDMVGTLRYMSPEQALARRGVVDHRTDIYSLGVTLYELLTLQPPFAGQDRQELLRQIGGGELLPPRRRNPAVPVELEIIVLKATAKEPAERYATAQDLADDLRRFLEHRPIHARRPGLAQRLSKWAWRHQAVMTAAVVILVLAVLTLVISTWLIAHSRQEAVGLREQAEMRERELRRHLYPADIGAAHRAWQAGNLKQARELLARYLPQHEKEELRGFEWYFLWDQCRPVESRTLEGHSGCVYAVAFAPDGKLLASASADHTLRLWDVAAGKQLHVFRKHTKHVNSVFFSPKGTRLATWSDDGTVRFWDVAKRTETLSWKAPQGQAIGAAFMPSGTRIAFVLRETSFEWWNLETRCKGELSHSWAGVQLVAGALSRDGERLALADTSKRVSIWDLKEIWDKHRPRLLHAFALPSVCRELAFSPDGKRLAAGCDNELVHLLALDPFQEVTAFSGHEAQVHAVAISPDGRTLASGGYDSTVRLWDLPSRMARAVVRVGDVVWSLAYSPDGKLLASGGLDGRVRLHSLPVRPLPERLHDHQGWLNSIRCSPDGQTLGLSGAQGAQVLVLLWDRKTGQLRPPQPPRFIPTPLHAIAYSPDSKTLAIPTQQGIVLWDMVARQQRAAPLTGYCQAFTPDSQTVATGSLEGDIRLWDAPTGTPQRHFAQRQAGVTCLAFSPDGQTLASGHKDGQVWLWDRATGHRLDERLPQHNGEVRFLCFSQDGHTLVTAAWSDDAIHVWDVAGRRSRLPFTGRSHRMMDLGLSPDGRTLAIATSSRVSLVQVATGQEMFSLEKHSTSQPSINFSADGQRLITGVAEGGELIVWHAPHLDPGVPGEVASTTERKSAAMGGWRSLVYPISHRGVTSGEGVPCRST